MPAAQGAGSINCHSLSSGGRGLHTSTDNRLVTMLLAVAFSFYIGSYADRKVLTEVTGQDEVTPGTDNTKVLSCHISYPF